MTNLSRKPLLALFAASAVLMTPLAFAQSATTTATQATPVPPPAATSIAPEPTVPGHATPTLAQSSDTPTAATPNTPSEGVSMPATPASTTASSGNKKTWSELDLDKDGNVSKSEAMADAGLKKIFAKADTNGDGILTPDEYKAYVAANYQASSQRKKGG